MRDLDIRKTLKATHLKRYYSDGHSRVIDELSLCRGDARVDVAVVNGALHGFEIKSELDTLLRLPNQIETYSKVFDYITVCAGSRHIDAISKIVPVWCGILAANSGKNDGVTLSLIRAARRNQNTDKLSIAQLLWKEEVIEALTNFGVTKGLTNKPKQYLWRLLTETASTKEVSAFAREKLKARSHWRSE